MSLSRPHAIVARVSGLEKINSRSVAELSSPQWIAIFRPWNSASDLEESAFSSPLVVLIGDPDGEVLPEHGRRIRRLSVAQ